MSFASVAVELLLVVLVILLLVLLGCVLAQCRLGKLGGEPLPATPALRRAAKEIRGGGPDRCMSCVCPKFLQSTPPVKESVCDCGHHSDSHIDEKEWGVPVEAEIGMLHPSIYNQPVGTLSSLVKRPDEAKGDTDEALYVDAEGDTNDSVLKLPDGYSYWNGSAVAEKFKNKATHPTLIAEYRVNPEGAIGKAFCRAHATFIAEVLPQFFVPSEIVGVLKRIVALEFKSAGVVIPNGGLNKAVAVFKSFESPMVQVCREVNPALCKTLSDTADQLPAKWDLQSEAERIKLCEAAPPSAVAKSCATKSSKFRAELYSKLSEVAQLLTLDKDMLRVTEHMSADTLRKIIRSELIDWQDAQDIIRQMAKKSTADAKSALFPLLSNDPVLEVLVCNNRLVGALAQVFAAGVDDTPGILEQMVAKERERFPSRTGSVVTDLLAAVCRIEPSLVDQRNQWVDGLGAMLPTTRAACKLELICSKQVPITALTTLAEEAALMPNLFADATLTPTTIASVILGGYKSILVMDKAKSDPKVFEDEYKLWESFNTHQLGAESKAITPSDKRVRCIVAINQFTRSSLTNLYYARGAYNQLVRSEDDGIDARKAVIVVRRMLLEAMKSGDKLMEYAMDNCFRDTIMRADMRAVQVCATINSMPYSPETWKKMQLFAFDRRLTFMCPEKGADAGKLVNADTSAPDYKKVTLSSLRSERYFAEGAMMLYSPCMDAKIAAKLLMSRNEEDSFKMLWQTNLVGIHLGGLSYKDAEGNERLLIPKKQRIKAATIMEEIVLLTNLDQYLPGEIVTKIGEKCDAAELFGIMEPGLDPLGGYSPFFFTTGDLTNKFKLLMCLHTSKRKALLQAIMVAPVAGTPETKLLILSGDLTKEQFSLGVVNLGYLLCSDTDFLATRVDSLAVELVEAIMDPPNKASERLAVLVDKFTDQSLFTGSLDGIAGRVLALVITDPKMSGNPALVAEISGQAFVSAFNQMTAPDQQSVCQSIDLLEKLPREKQISYIMGLAELQIQLMEITVLQKYLSMISPPQYDVFVRKLTQAQAADLLKTKYSGSLKSKLEARAKSTP